MRIMSRIEVNPDLVEKLCTNNANDPMLKRGNIVFIDNKKYKIVSSVNDKKFGMQRVTFKEVIDEKSKN